MEKQECEHVWELLKEPAIPDNPEYNRGLPTQYLIFKTCKKCGEKRIVNTVRE